MKKLLGIFLSLLIHISFFNVYANGDDDKTGRIKGVIVEEHSGQPMEFANVAVYNTASSALVSGGITDGKGEFEITGLQLGEYYLEANFIGFDKSKVDNIVITRDNPTFNSGKIKLSSSSVELEGVEVVADRSPVEFKLDKKVVNVSQMISATGGTAVEVLENTPSVQVDLEGNVSLRGSSNFTVLIDGRPSVLTGSDALRQIPASAIENIEIITNPSAKYEPDGTTGIINLVMKKNSLNGLSGIVNATIGSNDKYRGDVTLNYRTEKFNFFGGFDWRDDTFKGGSHSLSETYSGDTTSYIKIDGDRNFNRNGKNVKAGADWFVTDKSTLSLSGELGRSDNTNNGGGRTHEYSVPAGDELFSISEEVSNNESKFYSGTLSFQHKFDKKGHQLDALAFYSREKGSDDEVEGELLADEDYNRTPDYIERVATLENEKQREFRLKLDYVYPFSEDGKFEAGMLSRMETDKEDLAFQDYNQSNDSWIINEDYTSSTDFTRDIHAVYTTFSNKLGELQYMGGLRGELTHRETRNTKADEPSKLNRFDLFPTVHFSYGLGDNIEFMTSYSRRINRPRGRDLDPTPNYYNRYTIRFGNPDLKPEFTNSYELGAMYRFDRSYISLDAFHRITNNKIDRIETLGDDGIYYLNTDNFDKDYSTGAELTGNVNFTKWLLVNASVSLYHYRITGDLNGESVDRSSNNLSSRMNTTFKISQSSRLQLQGFFNGKSVSAQGERKAMIFTNISYRQDFWNNKLTATLNVRDILGTGKFESESYGTDFKRWSQWKHEPRTVMLTLSYKLNNFKEDRNNRGEGGGMDMDGGEF
ncbi:TonB-dependent receptor [Maribellus sp. YY47]|uniref:TonB-dependent receptor domain-containing protein n=1 Tax=Maribellus sp. YY47 TaxID=2929486 RepID=UPI0020015AAF|nr:TonB-dependent receptor [Maribellus sp. YY47]MCK3683543.1 TonB-dependent receptor [Maribellus sp. YY47]